MTDFDLPLDYFDDKKILIIDDSESSRTSLRMCVEAMGGSKVEVSLSYADALFRIRKQKPDIIICDYLLGEGQTGQDLLTELKSKNIINNLDIFIMVTAEREYEAVVAAVELTPDDYILKPFTPDTLKRRLQKIAQKKMVFKSFHKSCLQAKWDEAFSHLAVLRNSKWSQRYKHDINRALAETLFNAGKVEEAEKVLKNIIENYNFPWAFSILAKTLRKKGLLDEARGEIEKAITISPNYFESYDLMASICMEMGDHSAAQSVLSKISEKTPRNLVRKRLLAKACLESGDLAECSKVLAEVQKREGKIGDETLLALIRASLASEKYEEAKSLSLKIQHEKTPSDNRVSYIEKEILKALSLRNEEGRSLYDRLGSLIHTEIENFSVTLICDLVKAALYFEDRSGAEYITKHTMRGSSAKECYKNIRATWEKANLLNEFQNIQKMIAVEKVAQKPNVKDS